jgi:hypothetical protein
MDKQENNGSAGSRKTRSPAYPGINLEIALKRAQGLYERDGRSAVAFPIAVSRWGFGAKSSGGLLSVAALKSFGLLEDVERGPRGRIIKLTELAFRILLDKRANSPERAALIKQAALKPKMHATLWKKYGAKLPADDNLHHELVFDFKFNENTVDEFIKEYKDTIRFADLTVSDTVSSLGEDKIEFDNSDEQPDEVQTMQDQQVTGQQSKIPLKFDPSARPVGSSIPVSKGCVMSVAATGEVTQRGIKKLIDYLNLIKDSFPEQDDSAERKN